MTSSTEVSLPPDPRMDETRWCIGSKADGRAVEIAVRVDRLWWAVGEGVSRGEEPAWTDRSIPLTSHDFTATSPRTMRLRLPRERWPGCVRIGFDERRAKLVAVSPTSRLCEYPLRNLGGMRELEDYNATIPLKIWLRPTDDAEWSEGTIGLVELPRREEANIIRHRLVVLSLDARRLMRILSRIRRTGRGEVRRWVREHRRQAYRRDRRWTDSDREAFVREGLCFLAVVLDGDLASGWNARRLRRRWTVRARAAATLYPETVDKIRLLLSVRGAVSGTSVQR